MVLLIDIVGDLERLIRENDDIDIRADEKKVYESGRIRGMMEKQKYGMSLTFEGLGEVKVWANLFGG